jgi:hypothetical protein
VTFYDFLSSKNDINLASPINIFGCFVIEKNQDFACVYEIAFNNHKINVNLASKSTKKKKYF